MQNLFYIIFRIGSFPIFVLRKLYEALVLYPISLLELNKIHTRRATHSIVIEGYSLEIVWRFLIHDRNFNRWNMIFQGLTPINENENSSVIKKDLIVSEKGKNTTKPVFIKTEANEKGYRLSFQWASEESRIGLFYELQSLKYKTVLTRKIVFRTVGVGKYRMQRKFNADKVYSTKELNEIKKLLHKMSVGNQLFRSILKSPMIGQIRIS